MKSLEQLPQAAQRGLAGLEAGQNLKYRILHAVADSAPQKQRTPAWIPALACAMALVIALLVVTPALQPKTGDQLIVSQPAGQATDVPLLTSQGGITGGSISGGKGVPSYQTLWSGNVNGSMPVIGVYGAFYRMMDEPGAVSSSLLGSSVGRVEEFTTEPALSGMDVILSNVSASGAEVYAVKGMGGTLVAAQVNGTTRLFQRVGFNGSALTGGESLADTLQVAGKVKSLALSGVGTITDAAQAEQLMSILFTSASYESSGSVSGSQSLLISLNNGLTVQMAVKNDKLSACGTWSCPEFIEAFEAAVQ